MVTPRKVLLLKSLLFLCYSYISICALLGNSASATDCSISPKEYPFLKTEFDKFTKKYIPFGRSKSSPSAVAIYQSDRGGNVISPVYVRNSDKEQPVASTQKLITAYVAYRLGYLSYSVTLTRDDYLTYPGESRLPVLFSKGTYQKMNIGDTTTIGKMIFPLLSAQSNNQAAHAIARVISYRERVAFSTLMTREMNRVLAIANVPSKSIFTDPSGLNRNQKSTADNMARFISYVLADVRFRNTLVSLGFSSLENTYGPGIFGKNYGEFHKSGTTIAAGKTWIARAEFDDPRPACKNKTAINFALFGKYDPVRQTWKFRGFVKDTIESLQIALSKPKTAAIAEIRALQKNPFKIPKAALVKLQSRQKSKKKIAKKVALKKPLSKQTDKVARK